MTTSANVVWIPDARDIVWLDYEENRGREMQGRHPFLVMSNRNFNDKTKTLIGMAMTSKSHEDPKKPGFNPFQIKNVTSKGDSSFINTNQISTFDWETRGMEKHPWGKVSAIIMQKCKDNIAAVLAI